MVAPELETRNDAHGVPLAHYLFSRLKQLGILSVHGLPGDYNLTLLDYVEPAGLLWVGSVNELNAGYAADGYARIKGVGALVTTFGVGELSAINAIAGAYTERAAVVHIVGTPPRDSQDQRLMIHHTISDGDYRHFAQMASHVTVAQANLLDPRLCAEQIDQVLLQCLIHSRPVYIEVPVDMVSVQIPSERLRHEIRIPTFLPTADHEKVVANVLEKITTAERPLILVDLGVRSLGIREGVQQLVEATGLSTLTSVAGRGMIDSTLPNVHGIYRGIYGDADTKRFVDESDLILCFGPHFSSTNSYSWTSVPETKKTISFAHAGVSIGVNLHRDVDIRWVVTELLQRLKKSQLRNAHMNLKLPHVKAQTLSDVKPDAPLGQDKLWRLMADFLRPGDIILAETGTSGYGIRDTALPQKVQLFGPITWLSIGYMLPATQGAALAQKELLEASQYHDLNSARTVLFIGDGSLQLTVQEIATIIRHKLNVIIFVVNNDGYTIERAIHGMNQGYNDVSAWRYLEAPSFFGGSRDSYNRTVRTYGDLEQVLGDKELSDGQGLRMVELILDRHDVPEGPLSQLIQRQKGKPGAPSELDSAATE